MQSLFIILFMFIRKSSSEDDRKTTATKNCSPIASAPAVSRRILFAILTSIDYFPIPHNTLCLPPKFCINHCF